MNDEKVEKEIFDSLDTNKDGLLDQADLSASFLPLHSSMRVKQMEDWFKISDADKDGKVDFSEFHHSVHSQIVELRRVFDFVDANSDGRLDSSEVKYALEHLYGVSVSPKSIESMMEKIDIDKDGYISFEEWAKFLVFLPIHNGYALRHIFDTLKDEACIDCGEMLSVPVQVPSHFACLIAGGIAGAVSRTATAPLDRLKTLIQVHGSTNRYNVGVAGGLVSIWREGGALAFFRGNFANCLKIAPESATKFFSFEVLKNKLSNQYGNQYPLLQKFVAGAIAGAISQVLVYPLDSMKVRMAISPTSMSLPQAFRNTYAYGGVSSFYNGIKPCVLGVIPYAGIDLAIYETLKSVYTDYTMQYLTNNPKEGTRASHAMAIMVPLVCGTISSTIAQFFSYPFALVRTRLQSQGIGVEYNGMGDVFKKTVKKDGFFGLYKGMVPNLLKVVPAVGISYVVYEQVKRKLTV